MIAQSCTTITIKITKNKSNIKYLHTKKNYIPQYHNHPGSIKNLKIKNYTKKTRSDENARTAKKMHYQ